MTRRAARLAVLAVIAAIAAAASAAEAHPRGQRPVILVARTATGLDVSWIVAADDMASMGSSLRLGPIAPTAYADARAYQRYVTDGLTFTPAGAAKPCDATLVAVEEVATGYATIIDVECGEAVATATMRTSLLFDLSEEYVHQFTASTATGRQSGALTAREPSVELVLVGEPPAGTQEPDARGRLEAFARGEGGLSLLLAVIFAFGLGIVHGVTPGHGKTLAAAYVVGAHGTLRHAGLLAGVVALAHGISTFALAGIAAGVDKLAPETLTPWLEGATAVLAAAVGITMLRGGGHEHAHGETPAPARPRLLQLAAIGLIGGLIPGPEAFAVGFTAVALGNLARAAIVIGAFSLGLAVVVFAVAMLAVTARTRLASSHQLEHRARRVAGIVFLVVAVALAVRAIGAG